MGLIGTIAGLLALSLAIAVLVMQPRRRQNRRLALVLAVDAVFFLAYIGLPYFTSDARTAWALLRTGETAMMLSAVAYLSFLGTVDSPLTRWVRDAGPWLVMVGGGAMIAGYHLLFDPSEVTIYRADELGVDLMAWSFGWDSDGLPAISHLYLAALIGIVAAGVLGLVAAWHAWRNAPRQTPQRRRNGLLAIAFGLRDGGLVIGFGGLFALGFLGIDGASMLLRKVLLNTPVVAEALFVPVVVYAIIRAQVFGIELKVRRNLPRGIVLALIPIGFVLVSELIEELLTQEAGLVAGLVVASGLGLGFMPLQRRADRLLAVLMPGVADTPEYLQARRLEVYLDAFQAIVQDGRIEAHERVALDRLRDKLGLDDLAVQELEDQVVPPVRMPGLADPS